MTLGTLDCLTALPMVCWQHHSNPEQRVIDPLQKINLVLRQQGGSPDFGIRMIIDTFHWKEK